MGLAPGVVTGAYFVLGQKGYGRIDKVISVTTTGPAASQCERLVRQTLQKVEPPVAYESIRAVHERELSNSELTNRFTRRIERLLEEQGEAYDKIYLVLTGGRTSMAAAAILAVQKYTFYKPARAAKPLHLFHLEVLDPEIDDKGRIASLSTMLPADQDKYMNPRDNALGLVEVPLVTLVKEPEDLWARLFEFATGAYLTEQKICQEVRYTFYPEYLKPAGLGEIDVYAREYAEGPIDEIEEVDWSALRLLIGRGFSPDELRRLCFDLRLEYENIPGQTLDEKVRELLAYFDRRGQLAQLIEKCRQERPHLPWHDAVYLRQVILCECKLRVNDPEGKPIEVGVVRRLANKVAAVQQHTPFPVVGWVVSNTPYAELEAIELAEQKSIELYYARLPHNWKERANWQISHLTPLELWAVESEN
jgi:hypothetical protein